MFIGELFNETLSIAEAKEAYQIHSKLREDCLEQYEKIPNPTKEQKAWMKYIVAMADDMKMLLNEYIKSIE